MPEGRGNHNSTILFLKEAHSPRNFDRPPEVHISLVKAHNDIPLQPHNPLPVWVELHAFNKLSHTDSLTVPAIPPGSSTSLTDDWRGRDKKGKGHAERGRALPLATGPASNAQSQA